MSRELTRVAAIAVAILFTMAAYGDGSSGGAGGSDTPGSKTEDTGTGY